MWFIHPGWSRDRNKGAIMPKVTFTCPRCLKDWTGFPALSRLDNKTAICSPCGVEEGLDDYFGQPLQQYTN